MKYSQSAKLKKLQDTQYDLNQKNVCKYCFKGYYKLDQYEETSRTSYKSTSSFIRLKHYFSLDKIFPHNDSIFEGFSRDLSKKFSITVPKIMFPCLINNLMFNAMVLLWGVVYLLPWPI